MPILETLRPRTTHYPRTYFILNKNSKFYLLFWLEYGRDGSLYIWLDDSINEGWEVVSVHNQDSLQGRQDITLEHKPFKIYDPHISWHPSGRVHVSGYDKKYHKKKRVISDRVSNPRYKMIQGVTIPMSQIVLPSSNAKKSLKVIGNEIWDFIDHQTWVATLNRDGFNVTNNGASGEGYFIIDDKLVPDRQCLTLDISLCWQGNEPNFDKIGGLKDMLHPETFKINRGAIGTTTCIRIFSTPLGKKYRRPIHSLVTCFNNESVDLFQVKRITSIL